MPDALQAGLAAEPAGEPRASMISRRLTSRPRTQPPLAVGGLAVALALTAGCVAKPPPGAPDQGAVEPLQISTYSLSAGDEIRISVHGYPELDRTSRIPPDGTLFYPFVGDIDVHGLSIPDLRKLLAEGLQSADEQRISAGDEMQVSVYRHEELDILAIVPSSGRSNLPLAGEVELAGLTVEEANAAIAGKLSRYVMNPSVRTMILNAASPGRITNPQVSVEVLRFGGQKIVILGAVTNPGVYLNEGGARLLDIVALAGGPTVDAKLHSVAIVRAGSEGSPAQGIVANLKLAMEKGDARTRRFSEVT